MADHTGTGQAVGVGSPGFAQVATIDGAGDNLELEHIKPEFRERLARLDSRGLLAMGVRVILQENGFGRGVPQQHCGCPSCAQRCQVCAER